MGKRLTWDEYATSWGRLHGGFDPRLAAPVIRGWLRAAYLMGSFLSRLRISPMTVTAFGVLLCLGVPVAAIGSPAGLLLAAALVLLASIADSVDGALAVVSRRTSRLGYLYDSVADRLGEAAWLFAFWLAGAPGLLVVGGGGLAWLHEYVRARSVAAGMQEIGTVTVGERPTRVCVTLVGLLAAGTAGLIQPDLAAGVVTVASAVWMLLALFGLGQLFTVVRRTLG